MLATLASTNTYNTNLTTDLGLARELNWATRCFVAWGIQAFAQHRSMFARRELNRLLVRTGDGRLNDRAQDPWGASAGVYGLAT